MKRPSLSHSVVPPPSHSHSPLVSSAVRQTISQSRQTCVYKAFVFAHTPSKAGTPSSPLSNSAPCWCLLCAAPSPSASPSLSPCLRLPFHVHLCLAQSSSIYADIYIGWAPVEPNRAMAFYVGRHTLSMFPSRTPPPSTSPASPLVPLLPFFPALVAVVDMCR